MAKILVMFSGGLDSLGMTNQLLKSSQDNELHVHHIHIENVENRTQAEAGAVNQAIEYFRSNDYPKFIYTESRIAAPNFGTKFMYDSDAVNFMAGYISLMDTGIRKVAIGLTRTDSAVTGQGRFQRANQLLTAFTNAEKIYPVMDMTKQEIYDSLPLGLRDKFWSCRTPNYENGQAKACGKCVTCSALRTINM